MNTAKPSLSVRIRLAMLRGVARLLARAIAPALNAALRPAPANTADTRRPAREGDVIDGEFRRVDARHKNRW